MVDTPTTNKTLMKIPNGGDVGAWDVPVNGNWDKVDAALGGTYAVALTNANVTLTAPTSSATGQSSNLIYELAGALTANVTVTWPAVGGLYVVSNGTTGPYTVTATAGGAGVVLPQGATSLIVCDGTNMFLADGRSATDPRAINGRLTLVSGTPVMASTVSSATTLYYTPYNGNQVLLPYGGSFISIPFSEMSLSTGSLVGGQVYDVFAYLGTSGVAICFGPSWNAGATPGNTRARGQGAGSSGIGRVNGLLVNVAAISGGPAALQGLYLGSVITDATGGSLSFNTGGVGPVAGVVGVWNMYNRVSVGGFVRDASYYATNVTSWQAAHNSGAYRVTFVVGFTEDTWRGDYQVYAVTSGGAGYIGVGYNSTTAPTGSTGTVGSSAFGNPTASAIVQPFGGNIFSALECVSAGTMTSYGTSGNILGGLFWQGRY